MRDEVRFLVRVGQPPKEGKCQVIQFCTDGEYGTSQKLDEKLLRSAISPPTVGPKKNDLTEEYFKEKATINREKEMAFDLEKYKEERKKIKLENINEEAKFMEQYSVFTQAREAEQIKGRRV